jgi:GDP-L-fucose synthase
LPTNLYGPGDNYHPTNSHVLPVLIRRFHEAAQAPGQGAGSAVT